MTVKTDVQVYITKAANIKLNELTKKQKEKQGTSARKGTTLSELIINNHENELLIKELNDIIDDLKFTTDGLNILLSESLSK